MSASAQRIARRLAALVCAALALAPAPAGAHEGDPRFLSEVTGLQPAVAGVQVQVLNRDDALELRNPGRHTIVVEGYEGEPFARLKPDGTVEVNLRSPALYLNAERDGDAAVPAMADAQASPEWEKRSSAGRLEWHDHRMHYMGQGVPPQVRDPDQPTEVFDWSVPMRVDGRPVAVSGTLRWTPPGAGGLPAWAFGALGVLVVASAAFAVIRVRRRARPASAEVEAW
jgi:hypothetical protein